MVLVLKVHNPGVRGALIGNLRGKILYYLSCRRYSLLCQVSNVLYKLKLLSWAE
jgi:hypothetical protein